MQYQVKLAPQTTGTYRNISGNLALVHGLIAAARRSGLPMFLGAYPITPASDILHELSKHKRFGIRTFQAEDEIAGTGATLDIQRGGPSTGLPTKTEQSDLLQAMYGRNGEAPVPIVAPQSPGDCFAAAIEAARIALTYRTPVFLLSDGYLANGSEPWRVASVAELPDLTVEYASEPNGSNGEFLPYLRDPDNHDFIVGTAWLTGRPRATAGALGQPSALPPGDRRRYRERRPVYGASLPG